MKAEGLTITSHCSGTHPVYVATQSELLQVHPTHKTAALYVVRSTTSGVEVLSILVRLPTNLLPMFQDTLLKK